MTAMQTVLQPSEMLARRFWLLVWKEELHGRMQKRVYASRRGDAGAGNDTVARSFAA